MKFLGLDPKLNSVLALKFITTCAINISPFEAIRAELEKNIESDKYLDYYDETLERRRNFRAVLLGVLLNCERI